MIGLTLVALLFAWIAGFGMCYGALPIGDDRAEEDQLLGKWIGRFAAVVAVIFAVLALTVTK